MPLLMGDLNKEYIIFKIKGNEKVLNHLKNLGFVENAKVEILQKTSGGLIVKLYESRLAFDQSLASKIFVKEA